MDIRTLTNDWMPIGTYSIGFNEDDETQFFASTMNELYDLWTDFCDENGIDYNCVDYVELEQDDRGIFEEFLERTMATVYKGKYEWHVCEDGGDKVFEHWLEMIRYMDDQNTEMRGY